MNPLILDYGQEAVVAPLDLRSSRILDAVNRILAEQGDRLEKITIDFRYGITANVVPNA